MNAATSSLITQFITGDAIRICEPSASESVEIDPEIRLQVDLLKELTWYYVIDHPRIVSIRKGERAILKKLFQTYVDIVDNREDNRRTGLWYRSTRATDSGVAIVRPAS